MKIIIIKLAKVVVFCSFVLVLSVVSCEVLFHSYRYAKLLVSPNEDEVTFYVLGGSTAYGQPYEQRPSLALLISDYFGGKYNNRNIKISMKASPGKILKSNLYEFKKSIILNPQKHSIVLIYSGINEAIPRSYDRRDDFHFEYILKKTIVGTIILRMLDVSQLYSGGSNSLLKYKKELQDLAYWSKYSNHQVYLSELVGNFHDYSPEFHPKITLDEFKSIVDCEKKENVLDSLNCRKTIANRINFTPYYFMIARDEYKSNPNVDSLNKLDQFYKYDYSNRPIPEKNEIIRQVAADNNNMTLIPTLSAFKEASGGYIGYNLFVDAHHPNIAGMRIIANQFLKSITSHDDAEVHPLSHIEKKYHLEQRLGDITWSQIRRLFHGVVISPSYSVGNFYHLSQLTDTYHKNYDAAKGIAMHYLLYPLFPVYSKVDIWQEIAKHQDRKNKIASVARKLFYDKRRDKTLSIIKRLLSPKNLIPTQYIGHLNRAKKAGFISERDYRQYLSLITKNILAK